MNWVCKQKVGLAPWGPGEDPKGQISFNLKNKVNFKGFYVNFFVFLKIKDMKYIECCFFFILTPRSRPRVGLRGAEGGQGVKILFFRTWSCGISN